jgi:hypothetical protein
MKPAVMVNKPRLGSEKWREQVATKMLSGLGSEDIAIWLGCHPSHVSKEFRRLRADGLLQKWFAR